MTSADRFKLGDVIVWFQTGQQQDAKTDSDVPLRFYDDSDQLVGWIKAYERNDLAGFEDGEINCGYLGNINKSTWLKSLLQHATQIGIQIEDVSGDKPEWFLEWICLDFRIGPRPQTTTARRWVIGGWIKPGDEERRLPCQALAEAATDSFVDVGFERELEVQAGGPDKVPQ